MGDFTKLAVWRKAHELTLGIYRETAQWPRHELYGLTSQTRRAAVSVPSNVAEGCGKNSDAELARHARNSLGSASELSYYLMLAHDLSYTEAKVRDDHQSSLSEVRRMLASLERTSAAAADRAFPNTKLHRKSMSQAAGVVKADGSMADSSNTEGPLSRALGV
jgi:four helix bundle protein